MSRLASALALSITLMTCIGAAAAGPGHAIAMHGDPALPAGFDHFPYANPDAPKGGRVDYGLQGSFDSLNPFIVQGVGASGILDLRYGYNVFDSLMQRSYDEPFTLYPLLAKSVETDEERTFVEFTLDERARFSDGEPVTPEDVIFTLELLRDKGWPRYGTTVRKVARMEIVGERGVRLTFAEGDRELPLILGLMPILPKHATDAENFARSSLTPLIGSGPYTIAHVRPGELVVLKRNRDYWARDLPSKRGMDNYDEIRINYFRDENALFEAFKKGLIDVLVENNSGRWTSEYDFPAVSAGAVIKERFVTGSPSGMYGFVMNTRRSQFRERDVRRALAALFDFEWANRTLFAGVYARTRSFYDGSELSSHGHPASQAERDLLAPYADSIDPDILQGSWAPPASDGSGRDRAFLKAGFDALTRAGYAMKDRKMIGPDGRQLAFEIMVNEKGGQEIAAAWQRTLARLGIAARIRSVDSAQYQQRLLDFDFDVILHNYTSSLSPGVEQIGRWGSISRDAKGSMNYAGADSPAIDATIDAMLNARERDQFIATVRAYDRVLLSDAYVVPLFHQPEQWVARWEHIHRPQTTSLYGYFLPSWWHGEP